MKNPGVFSSRVLVRYTNIVYQNPGSPGILLNEPLANSQVVAWRDMGFVIEQNCCFIIVPIIVYLSLVVNLVLICQTGCQFNLPSDRQLNNVLSQGIEGISVETALALIPTLLALSRSKKGIALLR